MRVGSLPGKRLRWVPRFYYHCGNFGLLGEYAVVSQEVRHVNGAATRAATGPMMKTWLTCIGLVF